ncbi:MAG: metalloregulator ArsR/SmtB family transcription factor [Pirellulaceae bacterium]
MRDSVPVVLPRPLSPATPSSAAIRTEPTALSEPALKTLSEPTAKQLVQVFKLLADETRLRILCYLMQTKELNVRSLCELLDQSQPAVSHHLALMRATGLVDSRRDGKNNFYRILPERFGTVMHLVFREVPGITADKLQMDQHMIRYETSKTE